MQEPCWLRRDDFCGARKTPVGHGQRQQRDAAARHRTAIAQSQLSIKQAASISCLKYKHGQEKKFAGRGNLEMF
jgi:hypothetical protein